MYKLFTSMFRKRSTSREEQWTIHDANLALFETLAQPHPPSKRPALPTEIILQILSHPSRWTCSFEHNFPVRNDHEHPVETRTHNSTASPSGPHASDRDEGDNSFDSPFYTSTETETDDLHVSSRTSPCKVVWTPPLTAWEIQRIRKIVFDFKSHDQGWSSYPESHNTFEASWTWFEAALIRPKHVPKQEHTQATVTTTEGHSNLVEQPVNEENRQVSTQSEEGGRLLGAADTAIEPNSPPFVTWDIQRNRHASKRFESYCIEMDRDSELIQLLEEGDAIRLNACAMYPGWMNHVRRARIQIWSVDDLTEDPAVVNGETPTLKQSRLTGENR